MTTTLTSVEGRISALLNRKPIILQILRFVAIGAINTALDFIILNYITKSFNVTSGTELGILNIISFTAAIFQSYVWNLAWTFNKDDASVVVEAFRLILVGGLGFGSFAAVVLGAAYGAISLFYLIILVAFIIIEVALWILFRLSLDHTKKSATNQVVAFIGVSLIGLLINSLIISVASHYLAPALQAQTNADTIKNIAKALATVISLMWNFIGYKLIVFKR